MPSHNNHEQEKKGHARRPRPCGTGGRRQMGAPRAQGAWPQHGEGCCTLDLWAPPAAAPARPANGMGVHARRPRPCGTGGRRQMGAPRAQGAWPQHGEGCCTLDLWASLSFSLCGKDIVYFFGPLRLRARSCPTISFFAR